MIKKLFIVFTFIFYMIASKTVLKVLKTNAELEKIKIDYKLKLNPVYKLFGDQKKMSPDTKIEKISDPKKDKHCESQKEKISDPKKDKHCKSQKEKISDPKKDKHCKPKKEIILHPKKDKHCKSQKRNNFTSKKRQAL